MESKGTVFRGWIASLSNGETAFELTEVAGEASSWQQLKKICDDNSDLYVTQIRLQLDSLTFVGIPKADGYCQCWEQHRFPMNPNKTIVMRGIGSVLDDKVYLTWIDNSGNVKQEIRDYKSMDAHCIMK